MMKNRNVIWYHSPAKEWIEALPLGNGRMGAMVYGRALEEKIQLDESSFWSGEPSEQNNRTDSRALLGKLREALLAEDFEEADRIGHDFVGIKNNYGTNMPVANLVLTLQGMDEDKVVYQTRSLHLEDAIAETVFTYEGISYRREAFISNPAQVACVRFSGDGRQTFDLNIRYDGIGNNTKITGTDGEDYVIEGNARESLHSDGRCGANLQGLIKVITDGKTCYHDETIKVTGAVSLVLFIDLQTDMFGKHVQELAGKHVREAACKGYDKLKEEHIRDVKALYNRMDLTLGKDEKTEIPTDERIRRMAAGESDPALMAQMFQYGRYLLIASSRQDSPLPTHMGGIWNDDIYNNIDCTQDMHIDMNIEMQYWLAAQCNLPELYAPIFRYIDKILVPSGTKTAKEVYGANGWTAHIVTNPWGFTSLGWSYNWGVWSLGGVWCTTLLWDYYEYTADEKFLREFALPIIEGAVRFVLDYVFFDQKSGYYMTGPSYSPENMFGTGGKDYFLSLSTTCDVIMVREILEIMKKTIDALSLEETDMKERCQEVLDKLPPYRIGSKGQIQEWYFDFDEPIPNHRHTSQLLGLYPFSQIKPDEMPDLARAVRRSIELRYENFEVTSWGMAMLISYYARLKDGDAALEILKDTVRKIVKPNMASVMSDEESMWAGTWELDGNTGLTAAIGEMLLQSQDGIIRILPALPEEWKDGELKGICIRGGHQADLSWVDGKALRIEIRSVKDESKLLVYGEQKVPVHLKAGETRVFTF